MKVRMVAIDRVVPYARNPRKNADAVPKVMVSLQEFGWRQPIVVDSDLVVVAGHTRLEAARRLGMAQVPIHVAEGLSAEQLQAYRLADNRTGEEATWDEDLLKLELGDLRSAGIDLVLTGFGEDELAGLLLAPEPEGQGDPDEVPEPAAVAVTRPGDIWLLGPHRLMCGDSTSPEQISRLMAGALADVCFTSPPYAQQRNYTAGKAGDWDALMQGVFASLPVTPEAQVLVNLGLVHREGEWLPYWNGWLGWMREQGWRSFGWYVWDQGPGLPGDWNGRLAPSHEFIFHFNRVAEKARKTKDSKWAGHANHGSGLRGQDGTVTDYTAAGQAVQAKKIPDSVVRVMRHKARGIECEHPAVFPVELVTEMLTAFSDHGDRVFEPFAGSGTQIISAHRNGRICYGMELAPIYADVAVRRFQQVTGTEPVLEATGQTFDQARQARTPVPETEAA